jgi:hydroxymethylbilane synthase
MHPTFSFPIITMNTAGDKNQFVPSPLRLPPPFLPFPLVSHVVHRSVVRSQALYLLGGKALWTEELEAALHARQIDIIVHSLKDIPTVLSDEFTLSAVLERADPRDALVVKKGLEEQYKTLEDLPDGSVVGTSSVRRVAQLKRSFPNLKFLDVVSSSNLDAL